MAVELEVYEGNYCIAAIGIYFSGKRFSYFFEIWLPYVGTYELNHLSSHTHGFTAATLSVESVIPLYRPSLSIQWSVNNWLWVGRKFTVLHVPIRPFWTKQFTLKRRNDLQELIWAVTVPSVGISINLLQRPFYRTCQRLNIINISSIHRSNAASFTPCSWSSLWGS